MQRLAEDFVFGVSGFRARVGASFHPQNLLRFSSAFAQLVKETGGRAVVVGRDARPSGEMARDAVASGLLASGLDVIDVGIAPTPTILHAAANCDAGGSITITASHNPAEWNGLEFALVRGRLLDDAERERLRDGFDRQASSFVGWEQVGRSQTRDDALDLHIERILRLDVVNVDAVAERRPRVVIDACNGAGSIISPELARRLGCEVIELFCDASGAFPRSPEPAEQSLDVLRKAVVENGADIGFAHDGDADRVVLVDESGAFVPEEYTFALVADVILKRHRRPIVTTVVTGGLLDETARRHSVEVLRTPVGVGHVVKTMRETNAAVGGESTGGVVIPDTHLTTDGIAAIAVMLSGFADRGGTLSQWIGEWRRYHMLRAKLPLSAGVSVADLLASVEGFADAAATDRTDGLKFAWNDGSWVVVRPSGTEPVLRVFAESPDLERARRLLGEATSAVTRLIHESRRR